MVDSETAAQPDWIPDPDRIATSNLNSLMKRVGVDSYKELHAWSVSSPNEFWSIMIEDLGIEFTIGPRAVLGSADPEHPRWLDGAQMNIAESCLDGDPAGIAIVSAEHGNLSTVNVGELRRGVAQFASGFAEAGFAPGDRIAIAMPMTVQAVVAYLGVVHGRWRRGVDSRLVRTGRDPGEARPHRPGCGRDPGCQRQGWSHPPDVCQMHWRHLTCRASLSRPDQASPLREGDTTWSAFLGRWRCASSGCRCRRRPHQHPVLLRNHRRAQGDPVDAVTPLKAAMDGRYHQDIHSGDVVAWPTNLGWMMGPWLIYAALLNDAAIALYDDAPTSRGFVEFVDDAEVTMLGLVPSIVARGGRAVRSREGDWSTVRVISSTGEASNPDDYAWLMRDRREVPVVEYCGGTEIGGGYSRARSCSQLASRFTTPTLGLDLVLVDEAAAYRTTGRCSSSGPRSDFPRSC